MYKRLTNIKNEKLFYVWDVIALVLILCIMITTVIVFKKPTGKTVEIYVDGDLKYNYYLSENRTITIDELGHNVIEINDGKVKMIEADCPNKTCVSSMAINKSGEQIVCLPNRVVIVISNGDDGGELDAKT